MEKIQLPKDKVELIVNLDKYLNTDKEIVFGVRPEDLHDEADWVNKDGAQTIEVKVDVVEALGSETLLYCKTRSERKTADRSGPAKLWYGCNREVRVGSHFTR